MSDDVITNDAQPNPVSDLVAQLRTELQDAMSADITALKEQLQQALTELQAERKGMMDRLIVEMREERDLRVFAEQVTSTGEHALPVAANELYVALSALPSNLRQPVMKIMQDIHMAGVIDLTERGTSLGFDGKQQLEPEMAVLAQGWVKNGKSLADFFRLNEDLLGPMDGYDLSALNGGHNG